MKPIFKKGLIISISMVALISYIHVLLFKSNEYTMSWHSDMFKVGFLLICVFPIIYFTCIRADKSESLGLFLTSLILWYAGLADILFFWLQGKGIPATLPWLNDGIIGKFTSGSVVTSTYLYISVLIGFVIVYYLDTYLEKVN